MDDTSDQTARARALADYALLDTPPDTRFDVIVAEATQRFGTIGSTITLIDRDRQWFRARLGVEATETPLDASICAHVVRTPDVMVIEDASADPRFRDMDAVTSDGGIRFYAGAPLILKGGARVGTLCIFDPMPRADWDDADDRLLTQLAARVVAEFELKRDFDRDNVAPGSDTAWLAQAASLLARASVVLDRCGASAAGARLQEVIDLVDDMATSELV